jgi:2-dehydropantoate 2-reductase
MRFHVLGIGPIGSLLSYHLRRVIAPTHSITLIYKTQQQAKEFTANGGAIRLECGGIVLSINGFEAEIFEDSCPISTDKLSRDGLKVEGREPDIIESLFITTKAHQTLIAIQRLLPRLSGNSTVVLMQNGMGVYEQLVREVFRNPEMRPHFILASNTHGAWLKGSRNVVHAGIGQIQFGVVPDPRGRQFETASLDDSIPTSEPKLRLDDIAHPSGDPFRRYKSLRDTVATLCSLEVELNTSWKPITHIQLAMRQKLVVNAVINPLTAIMGCRNGDIFTTAASYQIMQQVCQEAADVYAAQIQAERRIWLDAWSKKSASTTDPPMERIPDALTGPSLEVECLRVAELTKGNVSSMLSDIRKGKGTEIDFLNGYLLNLGSTYNVPMPATATLLNLVKMRTAIPLEQAD